MSIKGLTDRGMAFPEIGQVRKGAPKDEKGQLGKDLTYFRVEFDEREVEAAAKFAKIYGDKPQEINILLPFNEIERVWDAWLEAYTAGRMVARADGEKYIYLLDTKTNNVVIRDGEPHKAYKQGEVVGTYKDGKGKDQPITCDTVGRLKVVIPELQRLAYMTVMTTSVHDIGNISAQLEALKHINGGQIAGIPMVLRRRPKKISTPKADGTRARYTKWMLSIEADPTWVKAKLLDVKHAALPGNGFDLLPETVEVEPVLIDQSDQEEIIDGEAYFDDDIPSQPEMDVPEQAANVRPYQPARVREGIRSRAQNKYANEQASKEQTGLLVGMLDACFIGKNSEMQRHQVCTYLTGFASTQKMPDSYKLALLDWLKPKQDSGGAYAPDPMAQREAGMVLASQISGTGQQELL